MERKVDIQLTDAIVRQLTRDFPGWEENHTYDIELCEFKTSEGKGKDFYRLSQSEGSSLIVKVFPTVDGSMGMTDDLKMRELTFVESQLYHEFGKIIEMPFMSVYRTDDGYGFLCMEDVNEELTKVGPPTPPTAEMVRKLIKTIGKFHRLYWQKTDEVNNLDWLMDFEIWVKRGVELLRMVVENHETKPEWAVKILNDKPGLERGMKPFMESLAAEDRDQFLHILNHPELVLEKLKNTPRVIGHNDLFFTNLGLRDDKILMIDWEFVGVSPAAWDLHCSYAGMPPVGVSEEEMLELYFEQIPEATTEEQKAWLEGYRVLGAVENLIYGLRTLIPAVFDPESKLPNEAKPMFEAELDRVVKEILQIA